MVDAFDAARYLLGDRSRGLLVPPPLPAAAQVPVPGGSNPFVMPIYTRCLVQFAYFEERPSEENEHCQVRIDQEAIVVTFRAGDRWLDYVGHNLGAGHFELRCEETKGRATLHMFEGGSALEGSWMESGDRAETVRQGFWRIFLRE